MSVKVGEHTAIFHVRTKRPNGSIPDKPLHAVDCSCGWLSGGNAIWYQTRARALAEFNNHVDELEGNR